MPKAPNSASRPFPAPRQAPSRRPAILAAVSRLVRRLSGADRTPNLAWRVELARPWGGHAPVMVAAPAIGLESLEGRQLLSVSLDASGYTTVRPQSGSRVIYVSSSAGNDINGGLSPAAPVKTLWKAESLMRDRSGDQMLLRAGDVWHGNLVLWTLSGKSAAEPMVIGSYGSGARPTIMSGTSSGFATGSSSHPQIDNLDILGIRFWADGRDPNVTAAPTASNATGIAIITRGSNILVEDCLVQDYAVDVNFQNYFGTINNVSFRRNVIVDAYATTQHSQGLYALGVNGLRIEGNVFDHNGYNEKVSGAGATWYNQNCYLSSDNSNVIVTGNVFARAAGYGLQDRPGGWVTNNLFLDDPVGMTFGLVNGATSTPGGVSGGVSGNLFVGGGNIGSIQGGGGMVVGNIKPGAGAVIADNVFTHAVANAPPALTLTYGIAQENPSQSVGINDLTVSGNIFNNWTTGVEVDSGLTPGGSGITAINRVRFTGNQFSYLTGPAVTHKSVIYASQETWSGNTMFNTGAWSVNGRGVQALGTAQVAAASYVAPARTPASYAQTLGAAGTDSAFLAGARGLMKSAYSTTYGAAAVIAYVKAGFATSSTPPPTTTARSARTTFQAEQTDASSGLAPDNYSGIGYSDDGDWAEYNKVDFGVGVTQFRAAVAGLAGRAGNVEIRLDSPSGKLVGTLKTAATGDWGKYALQTTTVSGATGVHNVYLVFRGPAAGVANIDWFTFA